MAKQLGFEQIGRDRTAVDGDEGTVAARAQIVDGARGDFLAGARFSEHEDGGIKAGDLADQADNVANRQGVAGRHADAALIRLE